MKQSLRERIKAYHQKNPGVWIPQGEIERLVAQKTTYTASNASRRLRELVEDGELEVKYVKGHAYHTYTPKEVTKQVMQIIIKDGIPVAVPKTETVLV